MKIFQFWQIISTVSKIAFKYHNVFYSQIFLGNQCGNSDMLHTSLNFLNKELKLYLLLDNSDYWYVCNLMLRILCHWNILTYKRSHSTRSHLWEYGIDLLYHFCFIFYLFYCHQNSSCEVHITDTVFFLISSNLLLSDILCRNLNIVFFLKRLQMK